ncbi:MAG: ABC transporter ATP-binding protein, partial [Ruminococcus sp.]
MITVEHLTKYYGRHLAVNDISFTINDNEILGFLGPNGAGKSTTMNMITGYLPMTKGTVNICGEDISKNPVKAKKNIGYLPEIPPVYPDMKVNEYLKFCAELKKIPVSQRKEQIESAIERLKLQDVSKRLIKNLSKGYKQRVGFAQALLGNPKFLILDEPTVGLDPEQVAEVRNIIRDLKKDHSVIFSSHILSEVSAVCDRVVIINKGEIKAIDTIENLEKQVNQSPVISLKAKTSAYTADIIIGAVDGVEKILEKSESDGIASVRFSVSGKDVSEVQNSVISALVSKNIQIIETYTEKPDLEEVFVKLVNQPTKRN